MAEEIPHRDLVHVGHGADVKGGDAALVLEGAKLAHDAHVLALLELLSGGTRVLRLVIRAPLLNLDASRPVIDLELHIGARLG